MKEILTSRERVRLALAHKETDRIPVSMIGAGINVPARKALADLLQRQRGISVEDYLAPIIDTAAVVPGYRGPALAAGTDYWGVQRIPMQSGVEEYDEIAYYPLANIRDASELAEYPWPEVSWFNYNDLPEQISAMRSINDYSLWSFSANPYETAWYMRGFEQFFLDLLENPDIAREILRRVSDFYVKHASNILQASDGGIDLYFTADDIAGQQGLLMALPMWEEFIKPCHCQINRAIHQFGVSVIYHSDGAVMDGVDGLLDMGIDVLQALQFDADGMDAHLLKSRYRDKLSFSGGISVQKTLPFGTPDEVRAEVRERIRVLGDGGGYLLGPSHVIQGDTPAENIVALFDTAIE